MPRSGSHVKTHSRMEGHSHGQPKFSNPHRADAGAASAKMFRCIWGRNPTALLRGGDGVMEHCAETGGEDVELIDSLSGNLWQDYSATTYADVHFFIHAST